MGAGNVYDEIVDGLKTKSWPNLAVDMSGAVSQGNDDIVELTQFSVRFTHRKKQQRGILRVVNPKKVACIRVRTLKFSSKSYFFDQLISDELCGNVDIGKICTKEVCLSYFQGKLGGSMFDRDLTNPVLCMLVNSCRDLP